MPKSSGMPYRPLLSSSWRLSRWRIIFFLLIHLLFVSLSANNILHPLYLPPCRHRGQMEEREERKIDFPHWPFPQIPPTCTHTHHEVELGVVIGKRGRDISEADAMQYVAGCVFSFPTLPLPLPLPLPLQDVPSPPPWFISLSLAEFDVGWLVTRWLSTSQDEKFKIKRKPKENLGLKRRVMPTVEKVYGSIGPNVLSSLLIGYDTWCPVGRFVPVSDVPDPANLHLRCKLSFLTVSGIYRMYPQIISGWADPSRWIHISHDFPRPRTHRVCKQVLQWRCLVSHCEWGFSSSLLVESWLSRREISWLPAHPLGLVQWLSAKKSLRNFGIPRRRPY